jgi:two-component system OmpR family response regulator
MAGEEAYDTILLDIMLPGRDGIGVVRSLRDLGVTTPVLFLTARTSEEDTVAALDAGGDDYLRKPFGLAELLARIRSVARRERTHRPTALTCGSIRYDPASRRATRDERDLGLTQRETAFLEYFLRNPGRVLSRDMIAQALWSHETEIESNVIDVYIRRLRAKLHGRGERAVLQTVRGIGYRLEDG